MNDGVKKKTVTKRQHDDLKSVEEAGMNYKTVGYDYNSNGLNPHKTVKCIVVRNFNKALVDSNTVDLVSHWRADRNQCNVDKGIKLGTILGRKLQSIINR